MGSGQPEGWNNGKVIVARGALQPGQYVYAYMRCATSFDNLKDAQSLFGKTYINLVSFYRDYGKHNVKPMDYHIYLDGHFREIKCIMWMESV